MDRLGWTPVLAALVVMSVSEPRPARGEPESEVQTSLAAGAEAVEAAGGVLVVVLDDATDPALLRVGGSVLTAASRVPGTVVTHIPWSYASKDARRLRGLHDLHDAAPLVVALAPDLSLLAKGLPVEEGALQHALELCATRLRDDRRREAALRALPDGRGLWGLIELYASRRSLAKEAGVIRELLACEPGPMEASLHSMLAYCYAQLGRNDEARAIFEDLLERYPGHPRVPKWRLATAYVTCASQDPTTGPTPECLAVVREALARIVRDGPLENVEVMRREIVQAGLYADLAERVAHWEWLAKYAVAPEVVIDATLALMGSYISTGETVYSRQLGEALKASYPESDALVLVEGGLERIADLPERELPFPTWEKEPSVASVGQEVRGSVLITNPTALPLDVEVRVWTLGAAGEWNYGGDGTEPQHLEPGQSIFHLHGWVPSERGTLEALCEVRVTGAPAGRFAWWRVRAVSPDPSEASGVEGASSLRQQARALLEYDLPVPWDLAVSYEDVVELYIRYAELGLRTAEFSRGGGGLDSIAALTVHWVNFHPGRTVNVRGWEFGVSDPKEVPAGSVVVWLTGYGHGRSTYEAVLWARPQD